MHHGQTLHPVLGLHEMDAVDHGVADFAMCMADDDDVRLGVDGRERGGVVLGADACGVVGGRPETTVNEHDLEIHAGALESGHRGRCRFRDAADSHPRGCGELRAIPQQHAGSCEPSDADLHGTPWHHHRWREQRLPAVVDDVR